MFDEEFLLLIELNKMQYTEEDVLFLNNSFDKSMNIEITLKERPSAAGWSSVIISLIFLKAFEKVSEGFLTELGANLYNWSKNKFKKIINDKEDFDDSRVDIKFNNCSFVIACNNKEDLLYAIENIADILIRDSKDATDCPKDPNLKNIHINRYDKKHDK